MPLNLPDRFQAEAYLHLAGTCNPGPWVDHSRQVARAAALISAQHPDLDPESGYILGLLHDIGRKEGVYGMRHVVDGYNFLMQEGLPACSPHLPHPFLPHPQHHGWIQPLGWDPQPGAICGRLPGLTSLYTLRSIDPAL